MDFSGLISDIPPCKVLSLQVTLNLNWDKWILVVDIPTQILLIILLPFDHSSWCKLKVYIVTHTKENICYLYSFTSIQNLKSLVQNVDFECRYIRTHTKEKLSETSNIIFAILPFLSKQKRKQKCTQAQLPSKVLWNLLLLVKPSDLLMVHFNIKSAKSGVE